MYYSYFVEMANEMAEIHSDLLSTLISQKKDRKKGIKTAAKMNYHINQTLDFYHVVCDVVCGKAVSSNILDKFFF